MAEVYDLFSENPEDMPIMVRWASETERKIPLARNPEGKYVHSEKSSFLYRGTMAVRDEDVPLFYRHGSNSDSPISRYLRGEWSPILATGVK